MTREQELVPVYNDQIRQDVVAQLAWDGRVDADDVIVTVREGVVICDNLSVGR